MYLHQKVFVFIISLLLWSCSAEDEKSASEEYNTDTESVEENSNSPFTIEQLTKNKLSWGASPCSGITYSEYSLELFLRADKSVEYIYTDARDLGSPMARTIRDIKKGTYQIEGDNITITLSSRQEVSEKLSDQTIEKGEEKSIDEKATLTYSICEEEKTRLNFSHNGLTEQEGFFTEMPTQ